MKCLLFFLLLFPTILFPQIVDEWGEVSPEHMKMTHHEKDSSAEAVILFDIGEISVSLLFKNYTYRHHRRIKLLKKSSLERGSIRIPYYASGGYEYLTVIEAQAILPDGKRIELTEDDFYVEQNQDGQSYTSFATPNLSAGTIIEYKYEILSKNFLELREWYFQHDIPVLYSKLSLDMPELLSYIYLLQGSENFVPLEEESTYRFQEEAKVKIVPGQYEMWNVPALKEEAFTTSYDDYRAKIRFQLEKIYAPVFQDTVKKYEVTTEVLSTWENLAEELETHPNLGWQYLEKKNHKKIRAHFKKQLKKIESEEEKVRIIYDYFRENIATNEEVGIFASTTLNELFKRKVAGKGGANLMLLAALRTFQIEAYPVLTSTREHGRVMPEHAIFDQFDYLLVLAYVNGKPIFLDTGNPLRPLGYPASMALNYKAWVVDSKNPHWVNIEIPHSLEVFQVNCKLEDGYLKGTIKTKNSGYNALFERLIYKENKEGIYWNERIFPFASDFAFKEFNVQNEENIQEEFYNQFSFETEELVIDNEDIIYISPTLYTNFSENPFRAKKRYSNIDFPFQFVDRYLFHLEVPEDYEIEQLPDPVNLVLPDEGGRFHYSVVYKQGKITINRLMRLDQCKFTPEEYETIRTMYDLILEKQDEQIVLRKIAEKE